MRPTLNIKVILVSFPLVTLANAGAGHHIRNLAEEIHRHFAESGVVEVPDMDSGVGEFHVMVSTERYVQEVTKYVTGILKRSGFGETAQLSRVDDWHPVGGS